MSHPPLSRNWARLLPWTNEYLHYCDEQEARVSMPAGGVSDGRIPRVRSCSDRLTPEGSSLLEGSHAGNNAHSTTRPRMPSLLPGWEYASARVGVRLARLAVYDRRDGIELGVILAGDRQIIPAAWSNS